jgi:predicted methyltransferase
MRNLLAGLGVALFIGACAGGAVPGIMMATPAPTRGENVVAAIADPRRPEADTARDVARQPSIVMGLTGVQPGWRVADIGPGGGYYTRLFAVAVGDEGRVYAIDRPNTPERTRPILAVAPAYPNVTVVQQGYQGWRIDEPLDLIFVSQIYHDFHVPALGVDVAQVNRDMFAALKPGGTLMIIDHRAVDGAPLSSASELHRIDPAHVVREVTAAGFVLQQDSSLPNPADDRTQRVFEDSIRGRTDQFILIFRKPA